MKIRHKWCFWIIWLWSGILCAQNPELRGAWFAWAGGNIPSKADIAIAMQKLADANFNIVYVDVWRNGFPYFRSSVFHAITGKYSDPAIEIGRDVLADFIAEGHRVGLEVDAWFEAGFMATGEYGEELFLARPQWFAKRSNGSVSIYGAGGKSLSHCHSEVQRFLIDLAQEVVKKYDIDGIEFDRIRYPELDCGYDSATVELYQSEHNGASPPSQYWDADWVRWRADKLTEFMALLYDSIKAVNPGVVVSNAPLPWGYEQFCQDWPPWINNGYLDLVTPQMYYTNNGSFTWRLEREMEFVTDHTKLYPGISTTANGVYTPAMELVAMIQTIRNHGLPGHVIWYHYHLIYHANQFLDSLRTHVYQQRVGIPHRSDDWRIPPLILRETDPATQRSTGWQTYSSTGTPTFEGSCLYTTRSDSQWVEYYGQIIEPGWYELYAFINRIYNATKKARYRIYSSLGENEAIVDQSLIGNAYWYKLGDFYFASSDSQKIVRLTNQNDPGKLVLADAMMLIRSNRPEIFISAIHRPRSTLAPETFRLYPVYPNPFNSKTHLRFQLSQAGAVAIDLIDLRGNRVMMIAEDFFPAGEHRLSLDCSRLATGVYFVRCRMNHLQSTTKILLLK